MNPISFFSTPFLDERERWFLWMPVFVACGIAFYFSLSYEPKALWLFLFPAFAALAFASKNRPMLLPFAMALVALSLGFNAAQIETRRVERPLLNEKTGPVSITGTLMRAEAMENGARLTLSHPYIKQFPKEARPATIRIKVKTPYAELPEPGNRVNVWGPLWAPNDSVIPGGYDFRRHAFFKKLGATGVSYVEPRIRTSKYPPRFGDRFFLFFERARRALTLMSIERLAPPQQAMTSALLSGTQSGIEPDIMRAMRASGLSHLLSISGVHVSMMSFLIYIPLRFFLALFPWLALRFPIKKIAAVAAILATSLYTMLVGADAPTVRSALMTGIVLFSMILDRKAMSLRIVALAALFIMVTNPSAVIGPSFQMSFAAVIAMVAAFEKRIDDTLKEGFLIDLPRWVKRTGHHLRDIIATSLVATAATTPFTIFHFQTFNFYGVVANMLALPLTSFWIMPCLLLTYITAPFGQAGLFIDGAGWGVGLLIKIAQYVASWPMAKVPFPPMPALALLMAVGGGLWLCLWRKRWRFLGLIPFLLAFSYPLFVTLPAVLIADEAPLWAVRLNDGRMIVYGKRKENFTTAQWKQHLGDPETLYFTKKSPPVFGTELSCNETTCFYKKNKVTVAFILPKNKKETTTVPVNQEGVCPDASVVVSFDPLTNCKKDKIIDAEMLREKGAHSITIKGDQLSLQTVRETRGLRPWSVQANKPSTYEPNRQDNLAP